MTSSTTSTKHTLIFCFGQVEKNNTNVSTVISVNHTSCQGQTFMDGINKAQNIHCTYYSPSGKPPVGASNTAIMGS